MDVDIFSGDWNPIPGYEDSYFISQQGQVCNVNGHIIKPIHSKQGLKVELRKFGQRECILVEELIEKSWSCSYGGSFCESSKLVQTCNKAAEKASRRKPR